jgi:hypothetical protein
MSALELAPCIPLHGRRTAGHSICSGPESRDPWIGAWLEATDTALAGAPGWRKHGADIATVPGVFHLPRS